MTQCFIKTEKYFLEYVTILAFALYLLVAFWPRPHNNRIGQGCPSTKEVLNNFNDSCFLNEPLKMFAQYTDLGLPGAPGMELVLIHVHRLILSQSLEAKSAIHQSHSMEEKIALKGSTERQRFAAKVS